MTISSIGESSHSTGHGWPAHATPAPPHSGHSLASTARLLGLSADQLIAALKAGTTLAQLAAHTGVSGPAVVRSVEQDLSIDAPDDGAELSDDQLELIASGIKSAATPVPPPRPRFDAYA
jgi:hypothetical protein